MSWHYQALLTLLDNKFPVLQVHEVYDDYGYTREGMKPDVFWEEDGEPNTKKMHADLIKILEMMLNDVKKYPPLDKRGDQDE